MGRERPNLGTPYGTDGPWLAAILDVLVDLHDLIDQHVQPARIAEPAPAGPAKAVPVSEPAPDLPPTQAEPVEEPGPDDPPDAVDDQRLPEHPPLSGKGSSSAAWADWATAAGVTVVDGTTRDDIIAACRDAGVIE